MYLQSGWSVEHAMALGYYISFLIHTVHADHATYIVKIIGLGPSDLKSLFLTTLFMRVGGAGGEMMKTKATAGCFLLTVETYLPPIVLVFDPNVIWNCAVKLSKHSLLSCVKLTWEVTSNTHAS